MNKPAPMFKKCDVTRAIRAATEAGLPVAQTRIEKDGSIVLIHTPNQANLPALEPFDQWKAKHNARPA